MLKEEEYTKTIKIAYDCNDEAIVVIVDRDSNKSEMIYKLD